MTPLARHLALRPIAATDEPFLYQVYAGTRADELALVDWNDAQKAAFVTMQFRAQHAHYMAVYPHASFQIVLMDGRPVGRLYLNRGAEEFRIIDIAILPESRGMGLGTSLIRAILDEAAARRVPVTIHVEIFNRARRLYDRLGFRRTADAGVYHLLTWSPAESPSPEKGLDAAAHGRAF
jgi:ribosomal protein S18 acetylase RimI-like enzyme